MSLSMEKAASVATRHNQCFCREDRDSGGWYCDLSQTTHLLCYMGL